MRPVGGDPDNPKDAPLVRLEEPAPLPVEEPVRVAAGRRSLPFLLPSGTLTAFLLLIVAVLAFTVVEHPGIYDVVGNAGNTAGTGNECMRRAIEQAGGTDAAVHLWINGQHVPGTAACDGYGDSGLSAGFLLALLTLLLATGLQYWFWSTRRVHRRGVLPVTIERFPALHAELTALADRVVPGSRVLFLIDLLEPAASGVAFGRVRRRRVLLGRGVLVLLREDPDALRALVLHELAHLRNRDVDIAIITLAFVRAFLSLIFLPILIAVVVPLALGLDWQLRLAELAQAVGLAALLVLARGEVLKNREYYADARATHMQSTTDPLCRILHANAANTHDAGARGWLRRIGHVHPTAASRIQALTDPAPLMYPQFGFAFLLGVCLIFIWDPSDSPMARLSTGRIFTLWSPEPFTIVLAALLVLTALRATLYARAAGTPVRLTALRWGLSLGVAAGTYLASSAIATPMLLPGVPASVEATNALILGGMAWLLVLWLELLGDCWAGAVLPSRRRWIAAFPIAALATLVLLCIRPLLHAHVDYLFAVHDVDSPLHALPGPLLVLTTANSIAVNEYLSHAVWLTSGGALLFVPLVVGRLASRHTKSRVPGQRPPTRTRRAVPWTASAAFVLAFAAVALSLDWYTRLLTGESVPIGPGVVLAASCAGIGAAVATGRSAHPVLMAMGAATALGLIQGALVSAQFLSYHAVLYCFAYGLETALAAALVVRALAPGRRSWPRRESAGSRPV